MIYFVVFVRRPNSIANRPFPLSLSKSSGVFDLVHVDIWGPYAYPTYDGFKYLNTKVDDFSRATWVFLI